METTGAGAADAAERVRRLAGDARALLGEASSVASQLGRAGKEQVEAHPYGMLLGAAAVGYVLGGGLAAPLTGQLLRAAARSLISSWFKTRLIHGTA